MIYRILGWLNNASLWAIGAAIVGCIPSIFSRRIRPLSGFVLTICTWIWGPTLWLWSAVTVYLNWGLFWLLFGLFLGGVGVVPVAFVRLLFARRWEDFFVLTFQIILVWGGRLLAAKMTQAHSEEWD
jgi:hypothetical protein